MRKEDKNGEGPLASVDQLMGALSSKPKGCGLDSWSGDMPRLQVWSPVSMDGYKSQLTDVSLSHQCFFSSLSPSLPLSKKKRKRMRN